MRKLIVYISLMLIATNCSTETESSINDIQSIELQMNNQEDCWNKGDITCFMESYWKSDSLSFIGKNGTTYGWEITLENYRKSYKDKSEMGTLTFRNTSIKQLNTEYIYVIGKWYLKRLKPLNDLSGHYTLVWKKINQKWVIISDHSS